MQDILKVHRRVSGRGLPFGTRQHCLLRERGEGVRIPLSTKGSSIKQQTPRALYPDPQCEEDRLVLGSMVVAEAKLTENLIEGCSRTGSHMSQTRTQSSSQKKEL